MTAFAPSDIPNTITTYEQLAVWVGSILADINASATVIESGTNAVATCQSTPLLVTTGSSPQWRNIVRLSIPLNNSWRTSTHPWLAASEISQTAVPSGYKVA